MNFRDFYDEHVAFVWRTLKRLGVSDSRIQDAMQDVLIVASRKLPELEPSGSIRSWLYRVCFRTAKDYRRLAHVRSEILDEDPVLRELDPGADAEIELQRKDDLAMLEAALGRLEEGQRTVFILFALESMTGEEISLALGLRLGTVYSRLRLAREAFRRAVTTLSAREYSSRGGIS